MKYLLSILLICICSCANSSRFLSVGADVGSTAGSTMFELQTGDYMEAIVRSTDKAGSNILVQHMSIVMHEI